MWRSKRKFSSGRPPALTKIGGKRIRLVRVRGGNLKFRALRLESGNFSWGSESKIFLNQKFISIIGVTRKTRILNCVYNSSNNEYVRTNTLVKNTIVQIDATPFRQWFEQRYGLQLGKKKKEEVEEKTKSLEKRQKKRAEGKQPIDTLLEQQFTTGRLYACISSRPGQSGRADGYILEGKELDFYSKKLKK